MKKVYLLTAVLPFGVHGGNWKQYYTKSGMYGTPAWTLESNWNCFGGCTKCDTIDEAEALRKEVSDYFGMNINDITIEEV